MIKIRKSKDRGFFDHGWLQTYHTFSFAEYQDPAHKHFQSLRVINEDYVAAGRGFGTHAHRDMEIVTYILAGSLEHKDSMGNGSVIKAGDVQYMSAGSGVQHSEFNPSESEPVHLLQIWLFPNAKSLTPRYDQKFFDPESKRNQLRLIVSGDGASESIAINQDAKIFACRLDQGNELTQALAPGRHGWLQLVSGELSLNGEKVLPGDGVAVSDESKIALKGLQSTSEFLWFDLAQA